MTQSHLTRFQKRVLDAVIEICAETGRAATIKEVAYRLGLSTTNVWRHTETLKEQGLLAKGRGLHPGEGRQGDMWRRGVAYAASEAERVLIENHAEPSLVKAVHDAMVDAQAMDQPTTPEQQ